jgi:hypothetical protein
VRLALENTRPGRDRSTAGRGYAEAGAAAAFRLMLISALQNNNQLPAIELSHSDGDAPRRSARPQAWLSGRRGWASYSLSWDSSRTSSNSFLTSYDPLVRSGLTDYRSRCCGTMVDALRLATTTRLNRDAGTRLKKAKSARYAVKSAYGSRSRRVRTWKSDRAQLAEEPAGQLAESAGQSPPLDLVSAQAEVVSNQSGRRHGRAPDRPASPAHLRCDTAGRLTVSIRQSTPLPQG